jgi:hypothetical protein
MLKYPTALILCSLYRNGLAAFEVLFVVLPVFFDRKGIRCMKSLGNNYMFKEIDAVCRSTGLPQKCPIDIKITIKILL